MTLHEALRAPPAAERHGDVTFRPMAAGDLPRLALQSSQVDQFGIFERAHNASHGAELVEAGPAWAAEHEDRGIICLAGFAEAFPPRHAIAWAMLGEGVGAAHFALRRFMLARIAEQPYRRIEAIARADRAAELKWLELLGFERVATMRAWGPKSEDHVLFELVRGEGAGVFVGQQPTTVGAGR